MDESIQGTKGSFYSINAAYHDALMQEINTARAPGKKKATSHAPLPSYSPSHRRLSKQMSRERRLSSHPEPPARRSSVASLASYTSLKCTSPIAKCRSATAHTDLDGAGYEDEYDDISSVTASDDLYDSTADGFAPTPTPHMLEHATPQLTARRIINDITPVTVEMQTFRDLFLREAIMLEDSAETPKGTALPVLSLADVEAELSPSTLHSPVPFDWSDGSSPQQHVDLGVNRLSGASVEWGQ